MSYKLMQNIQDELENISQKGLNTANLETAFKLVDMLKDLENIKYWECKEDYYNTVLDEMENGGYSQKVWDDNQRRYSGMDGNGYDLANSYRGTRGKHYVRGHYSRNGGPDTYRTYMETKNSYRAGGKDMDCKKRMLEALENHMDSLTEELSEMSRDADCREERETIRKYIDKIRDMM